MKKIERRAIMCLLLAVVLLGGLCVFVYRDFTEGAKWATFQGNRDVYADGKLAKGKVLDRHGDILLKNTSNGPEYNNNNDIRAGCMHVTGDKGNNIATGANRIFLKKLIGYSFVNGIYSIEDKRLGGNDEAGNSGKTLKLTIDGDLSGTAYDAMNGQRGAVGVFNYKTGEILCMVSGPTYDPEYPPEPEDVENGTYINNFTSSKYAPGSTFKLVTAAAAIETDNGGFEYDCDGVEDYGHGDKVTDENAHGDVDLKEALEVSCNCYFGKLAEEVGGSAMEEYTKKAGLMDSYDIDGIETIPGTFDFPDGGVNLAWTGIGQYHDMVNPCAMMVYAGAIANEGEAAYPYIIDPTTSVGERVSKLRTRTDKMIKPETAAELKEMMRNNVEEHYDSDYNFPNLPDLCAKTGTAEVEGQDKPNSWFVGFLDDEEHPYAFVVIIEEGGYGIDAAGSVANRVLEDAVRD